MTLLGPCRTTSPLPLIGEPYRPRSSPGTTKGRHDGLAGTFRTASSRMSANVRRCPDCKSKQDTILACSSTRGNVVCNCQPLMLT